MNTSTQTLRQINLESAYEDVHMMIHKVVWKFFREYGGAFEEWEAEANYLFIIAHDSYEEAKGRFSTWVYFRIWRGLLTQESPR